MPDLISFYRSRVIYDLAEYEEDDFTDRVLLCVPRFSWLQARNLMRGYGLRLNAYAMEYTSLGYFPPDAQLFDQIDESISDFLGEDDMCQELTEALNNLAAAFTAGCCGTGSYGAGEEEPAPTTSVDDGEDPPPGFDTYAEYRTYKCAVANRIIEGIRQDIVWLGAGTLVTLTASGLVAALLTPIPGDEILLLVGFVVSLLLQGVLASTAAGVEEEVDDNRQSLVCLLYDAENATEAKSAVTSFMASVLTSTEAALFAAVWSFASVNALFVKDVLFSSSPLGDEVSCSLCGSECELCITAKFYDEDINGIFTPISETEVEVVSGLEQANSTFWGICDFNTVEGTEDFCGPAVTISSYSMSGFTPFTDEGYRIYNSALSLVYESSTPPVWASYTDVRRLQMKSTTAWTGDIVIE